MPPSNRLSALKPPTNSRRLGFLVIFLLTVLLFYPAFEGEFLYWDDDVNITANPNIKGLGWEPIRWSFANLTYYWRYQPLAWLTWNVLYELVGFKPFLYHAAVVVLYAATAGLLFLLTEKLLRLVRTGTTQEAPVTAGALWATILWAVHPMHVEVAAWAVELVMAMPLFFFVLSLLAYVRANEANANHAKFLWLSVLCFALSLFTFPVALGGLVVFVALDICPFNRIGLNPRDWFRAPARPVWIEKIPFVLLTLLAAVLNFYARWHQTGSNAAAPVTSEQFGLLSRSMQGFYMWAYYVWKPLLPFHLTPVPLQLYKFDPLSAPFVGSAVFVAGLTIALLALRRRWPAVFLVWVCYLGLLVPMLGLTENPHFPSDRYSLIAGIGFTVLLAGLLAELWRKQHGRWVVTIVVGVVAAGYGVMSHRQTLLWQNNQRFLSHVLATLPADSRGDGFRITAHLNLAKYYLERGDAIQSASSARDAIHVNPTVAMAHQSLGNALITAGDLEAASASLMEAVRLKPSLTPAFNNLGVAYAMQGRLAPAAEQFRRVLRFDPNNANARQNLSRTLSLLATGTNSPAGRSQ